MKHFILALLCLAVALAVQAQGVIQEPIDNWTEKFDARALDACLRIQGRKVDFPDPKVWLASPSQPNAENAIYDSVYGLKYDPAFRWCIEVTELLLEHSDSETQPKELGEQKLLTIVRKPGVIITLDERAVRQILREHSETR
jgi:hypothetical protein